MNRIGGVALVIGLTIARASGATTIFFDTWVDKASELFNEWSFGAKSLEEASGELREIAENTAASDDGRAQALNRLVWMDISVDEVDFRSTIAAFADRKDVPGHVRLEASMLVWQLRVFGRGLGETPQLALLRRIAAGRARGRSIGIVDQAWAATELCARGYFDEAIRKILIKRHGNATQEIRQCEQQRDFISSERDLAAVQRALLVQDRSESQAFRILVLQSGMALKGSAAAETVRKVVGSLGRGEPPVVLATRSMVMALAENAPSPELLKAKGIHYQVAALVSRGRSKDHLKGDSP